MGIKANFNMDGLKSYAEKWKESLMEDLKVAFQLACMEVVANAKRVNTYIDQTGNLRSSIGYVIYYNGKEIESSFSATPADKGTKYIQMGKNSKGEKYGHVKETPGGTGQDGVQKGIEFARQKAGEHGDDGFVAVVVAGMEYAAYVEAKGFDVLTGSTLRFEDVFKKHFANVNNVYGTNF